MELLSDVVMWVENTGCLINSTSHCGASGSEHPRGLGVLSRDEVVDEIKTMIVGDKLLTLVHEGVVWSLACVCRLVIGTETFGLGERGTRARGWNAPRLQLKQLHK